MNLSSLPPLRDVIRDHDLRAEKKFGQNFLLDQNLTDKIVRVAGGDLSHHTVFEIGPGPGGLTRSLLHADPKKLIAIEFDPRAIAALSGLQSVVDNKLELIEGDALIQNLENLSPAPRMIVANLPYNIATPLLIGWLRQIRNNPEFVTVMVLMFQKEVAHRITAQTGDKDYGRLAVMANWLCDTKKMFDVPSSAFTPPPKVTSSIVRLIPKALPEKSPDFKTVEKITEAAFGQRRKMIRTSLKNYAQFFEPLGLKGTMRAEEMTGQQFIDLARLSKKP